MARLVRFLLLLSPLWLTLLTYGYALGLPLFSDDAPNFHFMRSVDMVSVWAGSPAFPYYRPLIFNVWQSLVGLTGGYSAPLLHALNLLSYGMTGVLLGLAVRRLLSFVPAPQWRAWVGALAGCLYALFPFNYQTVLPVGSLFHVALGLGAALALLGTLRTLQSQQSCLSALLMAWVGAGLAIFSHENGFLVLGLMLGGVLFVGKASAQQVRRALSLLSLPVVLAGVYLFLYASLPRMNAERGLALSLDPVQGYALLLQGFVYPVAGFLRPFISGRAPDGTLILLFSLSSVLMSLVAWRWQGLRSAVLVLMGAAWFVVAVSPSALLLQPDYVYGSPRLATFASLGACVAWAVLIGILSLPTQQGTARRWRQGLGLMLAAWCVVLSFGFLWARRYDYQRMSEYHRALIRLTQTAGLDQTGFTLVNAPYYLEAWEDQRSFLTGAEYASFVWVGLDYDLLLWVNTEDEDYYAHKPLAIAHAQSLRYNAGHFVPIPDFREGAELTELVRSAPALIATHFSADRFMPQLVKPAQLFVPASAPALAQFGDFAHLQYAQARLEAGRLSLESQWQSLAPAGQVLKRFVHVLCDGVMIAQADGGIWNDMLALEAWQAGETWADRLVLDVPVGTPRECLTLKLGIYQAADGGRLAGRSAEGEALADSAWTVTLAHD